METVTSGASTATVTVTAHGPCPSCGRCLCCGHPTPVLPQVIPMVPSPPWTPTYPGTPQPYPWIVYSGGGTAAPGSFTSGWLSAGASA